MRCAPRTRARISPTLPPTLLGPALLGVACCAWMASPALAATVTAISDTRAGQISVFSGIGVPISAEFEVIAGQNDFDPITFDECVSTAGRVSCMDFQSSFLDLGPGNVVSGFTATGALNSNKAATGGFAISDTFFSVQLQVSGLPNGGTTPFTFSGSLVELSGSGVISLSGPGVSLSFNQSGNWEQIVLVTNGVYTITVDAEASIFPGSLGVESVNFSVTLVDAPPTPPICTSASTSCFLAQETPGCSDATCCPLICAVDPFCCTTAWDGICVDAAIEQCSPDFLSTWATDPATGHRYRVVSPQSFDEADAFIAAANADFVSIDSGRENNWVRREFAAELPGLDPSFVRIGFTDSAAEGIFTWTNGSPVGFTRWAPGEPNNFGNEDTTILSPISGLWNDIAAGAVFHSVAEQFDPVCINASGSCFTPHGPGCNDQSCCNEVCFADPFCCDVEWDSICVNRATATCNITTIGPAIVNPATGSRYRLVGAGSWLQVAKVGIQQQGRLVTIETAAENEWIRQNFLTIAGQPTTAWIGATDQRVEDSFGWIGGEPLTFTAWAPGEPNDSGAGEDFTVMLSNGLWNDVPNELTAFGIIEIPCSADLDGDGLISGPDLGILLGAWGSAVSVADVNGDATVDAADLAVLLGAWGACPTSNACFARPSPGSDQPGCTTCVCELDPFCCQTQWDNLCVGQAANQCNAACQCGG